MLELQVECKSCGGTGLYRGFAEPEGVAVVCLNCKGSGAAMLRYNPFTGRKERDGIREVRRSGGTCIATGIGPRGGSVSYEDFVAGRLP